MAGNEHSPTVITVISEIVFCFSVIGWKTIFQLLKENACRLLMRLGSKFRVTQNKEDNDH